MHRPTPSNTVQHRPTPSNTVQHALSHLSLVLPVLFLKIFTPNLCAQTFSCATQADFTYVINSCNVSFTPSYSGSNVISHEWRFTDIDASVSSTDISNPTHTFNPGDVSSGTDIREVEHIITLLINGSTVTYTCKKTISVVCEGESYCMRSFQYEIHRCTIEVISRNPGSFDFGDGTTVYGNHFTHVYANSGTYTVSYLVWGEEFPCEKTIEVDCSDECCDAAFFGSITQHCSKLTLQVTAVCPDNEGTWSIETTCVRSVSPLANNQAIQLTNVNTNLTNVVRVTHTVDCPGGYTRIYSRDIPINANGIFIGIEGVPTNLTDYECVLPGSAYNGLLKVYVSGVIKVNKSFTFTGSKLQMDPAAGFDVPSGYDLTLENETLVQAECDCLWRGFYVWGQLNVFNSVLKDALYAIRSHNGAYFEIEKSRFNQNFIGMRTDRYFTLGTFRENIFDGAGPIKSICGLSPEMADIRAPGAFSSLEPVVFQSEKGFAGMRVNVCPVFNLPPLAIALQNQFRNLAVGIDMYNTNADLNKNARFSNITGGAYGFPNGVGVRLWDDTGLGGNGLRFRGNEKTIPDFQNSTIALSAYTISVTTGIDVADNWMANMQNGLWLISGGTIGRFSGAAPAGIYRNQVDINALPEPTVDAICGITLLDSSPALSALDIWENNIMHTVQNTPNPRRGGIYLSQEDPGNPAGQVETNIYRNSITVENGGNGTAGIIVEVYNGVRIQGNQASATPTGGIFVNNSDIGAKGIFLLGGNQNIVACNDIISTSPGTDLFFVQAARDGVYEGNRLKGTGTGARFALNCGVNTRFRCNEMKENTQGLLYFGAQTGPQGSLSEASGNRWVNNGTDATFIGGGILLSQYYARTINNEYPINPTPSWFNPVNAAPACASCTYELQAPPADLISPSDELVVGDAIHYAAYDAAMRWWNRWNLALKLSDQSSSATSNEIREFKSDIATSALGRLVDIRKSIDQLGHISPEQDSVLNIEATTVSTLKVQLNSTDAENIAAITQLLVQLEGHYEVMEDLLHAIAYQKKQDAAGLEAQLNNIVCSNVYETNEKTVLGIYLQHISTGAIPPASLVARLGEIGSACALVNGPVVYLARTLYKRFTKIALADVECSAETEERRQSVENVSVWAAVYPNPTREKLNIQLSGFLAEKPIFLTIYNVLGQAVLENQLNIAVQELDISNLKTGQYFARITQEGRKSLSLLFTVSH